MSIKLHVLTKRMCPTCIGTTTYKTWSLYFSIEKDTKTYLFTWTSVQSFNHCCSLYGLWCFKVGKFNFCTKLLLTTLVQLPPSIIMLHNFLLTWHLVWKKLSNDAALKHLLLKKEAKSRLIRWILLLQEFNLEILNKNGTKNLVANHLSRLLTNELSSPLKYDFLEEHMFFINETTP